MNSVTLQWELKTSRGRSPPGRGYHVALLHDARILIFGGYNGTTVFDDLWGLELGASAYLPQVVSACPRYRTHSSDITADDFRS